MIKSFAPQPFDGLNILPNYVSNVRTFTLVGRTTHGYDVSLAKLTVGESVSAGNPLTHALFESFSDHGERKKAVRTRVSGCDREFVSVKNAMSEAGIVFNPTPSAPCEEILLNLGAWFQEQNNEITQVSIVSQSCH